MRGPIVVCLFSQNQHHHERNLACSSYTTSLQSSKTNSPIPEKQMSAASGSSTPSWQSSSRLPARKHPISADASQPFSVSEKEHREDQPCAKPVQDRIRDQIGSAETQTPASGCGRQPFALLHDGRFGGLDLREPDGKDPGPATHCGGPQAFRLLRCAQTFSDVRRSVAQAAADNNFGLLFPVPCKSMLNSFVNLLLRMAA